MQRAYINALYDLMQKDNRVVSLLSDSGTDYDVMLEREFPSRCFNFGIAEQNKVAVASGMAAMGKIPFVYTTGTFLAYRAFEFIRNDVCIQKRNVKLVGLGMGVGLGQWSTLGVSHHSTEDISALRTIPNLTLLCAATPLELQKCVEAAYEIDGPVYIRMGMSGEEELYDDSYEFSVGKLSKLLEGDRSVIFTTGTITAEVLTAARRLQEEGHSIAVYNVHTLSPINAKEILAAVSGKTRVYTIEEHSIFGGLGGAVAEALAEAGAGVPLTRIGLEHCFAKGYGTLAEVRALNGLDAEQLYQRLLKEERAV